MTTGKTRKKMLAGIKVLDFTQYLAGPAATRLLADFGAEVIKIERTPAGDLGRKIHFVAPGISGFFLAACAGKKSVAVEFASVEGQKIVHDLVREVDVVVENYSPGVMAKYGFDYESVKSINPALIYCSITGFGQTGPYAHRAGYDYIIQGMSGFMSITGESGGMPQRAGVAVTDLFTGLYATTAILSALHMRNNTGQGQHIDMALLDCAVSVMVNQAMNFMSTGVSPERVGNIHPNLCPYQVFECSDGHIIIAVGNDGQFARLCSILDLENLSQNPLFVTNKQRVLNRNQLTSKLSTAIRLLEKNTLLKLCEDKNVPAGPINTMEEN